MQQTFQSQSAVVNEFNTHFACNCLRFCADLFVLSNRSSSHSFQSCWRKFKMLSTARRFLNPFVLKETAKTKTLKNDKLIHKHADLQVIACCIEYQRFRAVWSELRKRSRNSDVESITLLVCKQLLFYLIYKNTYLFSIFYTHICLPGISQCFLYCLPHNWR